MSFVVSTEPVRIVPDIEEGTTGSGLTGVTGVYAPFAPDFSEPFNVPEYSTLTNVSGYQSISL